MHSIQPARLNCLLMSHCALCPTVVYPSCRASLVSLIGLSAIVAETNEDDGPLPKRLKLEGDRSRTKLQSPQFHSESLLSKGDQFHPSLFMDFHRQYWGKPLDPAFKTLPTHGTDLDGLELDDEEDDILPGDPFLDVLDRRFLIRAEYIRAFDKVTVLYDKYRRNHLAVVTGQPGIGATPSAVRSA